MGHDSRRVRFLSKLVARGYTNRLLLAQDIALKFGLRRVSGVGYAHVPNVIVPMLRRQGVGDEDLTRMLVDTPREVLTIEIDVVNTPSSANSSARLSKPCSSRS